MIYLITKPQGKKAYYSFRRLIVEEQIKHICDKSKDQVPSKESLPVKIAFNQITIEKVELDERL